MPYTGPKPTTVEQLYEYIANTIFENTVNNDNDLQQIYDLLQSQQSKITALKSELEEVKTISKSISISGGGDMKAINGILKVTGPMGKGEKITVPANKLWSLQKPIDGTGTLGNYLDTSFVQITEVPDNLDSALINIQYSPEWAWKTALPGSKVSIDWADSRGWANETARLVYIEYNWPGGIQDSELA